MQDRGVMQTYVTVDGEVVLGVEEEDPLMIVSRCDD